MAAYSYQEAAYQYEASELADHDVPAYKDVHGGVLMEVCDVSCATQIACLRGTV